MHICGLQKLTLLDFPNHTACTVFTGGCNYRCPFCQNSALVLHPETEPGISEAEFFAFLEKRRGLLDGVAITGGEPTLQPDLREFILNIRSMGFAVKLDTNGSRFSVLSALIAEGLLDYVAMDIKNSPEFYVETVGVSDFRADDVFQSVDLLLRGTVPYEFRTTIVEELHSVDAVADIAAWIRGASHYYLQSFEDSGDILQEGLHACTLDSLKSMLAAASIYVPSAELRGVE